MKAYERFACGAALLLALTACGTPGASRDRHAHAAPAGPVPGVEPDASYDWHGLVLVHFGTLLKESPLALHEVLLFHDEAPGGPDADGKDCYATDGTAPRFVGHPTDQYLLCFDHDRLSRIEASVRLTAEEAPQVFARACAMWLKNTAPTEGSGHTCEGRDGGIAFSARLALAPGEAAAPLSMTLADASDPPHAP